MTSVLENKASSKTKSAGALACYARDTPCFICPLCSMSANAQRLSLSLLAVSMAEKWGGRQQGCHVRSIKIPQNSNKKALFSEC